MFAINNGLIQNIITIFFSIIIEAYPFVILGVIVSMLIKTYIRDEYVLKYVPKNRFLSHLFFCFIGFLLPVCECGNVPVARGMIAKGFKISHVITFLLAAPILNPITYLTTSEAFRYNPEIVFIRLFGGAIIALIVGLIFSLLNNQENILSENFIEQCNIDHEHHNSKISNLTTSFVTEILSVNKALFIGALLASLSQNLIPRNIFTTVGADPILSVISMIILAFIISICSNVDAFFALSYSSSFTKGSILSFLTFGPMIDIKILTMSSSFMRKKYLLFMTILVFSLSAILGLLINYLQI